MNWQKLSNQPEPPLTSLFVVTVAFAALAWASERHMVRSRVPADKLAEAHA